MSKYRRDTKMQEHGKDLGDSYGSEFLTPHRSPKKGLAGRFRKGDKKGLSPLSLMSPRSRREQRRTILRRGTTTKSDSDTEEDFNASQDLAGLLSPGLEKDIERSSRQNRSFTALKSVGKALKSPFGTSPREVEDSDSSSSSSSADETEGNAVNRRSGGMDSVRRRFAKKSKKVTEDDMMLLLCRELELIGGDGDAKDGDSDIDSDNSDD